MLEDAGTLVTEVEARQGIPVAGGALVVVRLENPRPRAGPGLLPATWVAYRFVVRLMRTMAPSWRRGTDAGGLSPAELAMGGSLFSIARRCERDPGDGSFETRARPPCAC